MSYGLQIAASGVFEAMYRQDVHTNNLANLDTPGFKPDLPRALSRRDVRHEDGVFNLPSDSLLERLGGGVLVRPNSVDFSQGPRRTTGADLDLAIQGDGFFVVRDQADVNGDSLRLTRDGRFTRNAQGLLVMASTGMPVVDTEGNTIALPTSGRVSIDGDGTIMQGAQTVGKIQFVDVADKARLVKRGHSLFGTPADAWSGKTAAAGTIRQGELEDSCTDEIMAVMRITGASRDVDSNVAMIQQHDRMLDRAINTFGRVV